MMGKTETQSFTLADEVNQYLRSMALDELSERDVEQINQPLENSPLYLNHRVVSGAQPARRFLMEDGSKFKPGEVPQTSPLAVSVPTSYGLAHV